MHDIKLLASLCFRGLEMTGMPDYLNISGKFKRSATHNSRFIWAIFSLPPFKLKIFILKIGSSGHRSVAAIPIMMARPLLANVDLLQQFRQGTNSPARPCTHCNRCVVRTAIYPLGCFDRSRFASQDEMEAQIMEWSTASDEQAYRRGQRFFPLLNAPLILPPQTANFSGQPIEIEGIWLIDQDRIRPRPEF